MILDHYILISTIAKCITFLAYTDQFLNKLCQLVFERCSEKERVIVAINAADYPYTANAGELNGTAADLLTGETVTMNGQLELKPYSVQYLKF